MSAAREAKPSEGRKGPSTRECGEADTRPQPCLRSAKEAEGVIGPSLSTAACPTWSSAS
jgi:hypothetical protein